MYPAANSAGGREGAPKPHSSVYSRPLGRPRGQGVRGAERPEGPRERADGKAGPSGCSRPEPPTVLPETWSWAGGTSSGRVLRASSVCACRLRPGAALMKPSSGSRCHRAEFSADGQVRRSGGSTRGGQGRSGVFTSVPREPSRACKLRIPGKEQRPLAPRTPWVLLRFCALPSSPAGVDRLLCCNLPTHRPLTTEGEDTFLVSVHCHSLSSHSSEPSIVPVCALDSDTSPHQLPTAQPGSAKTAANTLEPRCAPP